MFWKKKIPEIIFQKPHSGNFYSKNFGKFLKYIFWKLLLQNVKWSF